MARPFTPSPLYPYARAEYDRLCAVTADASARLAAVPGVGSGAMGLTPDSVRSTPAYRDAKARHAAAFEAQRRYAPGYVRTFKREIAAERAARIAPMVTDATGDAWAHARMS